MHGTTKHEVNPKAKLHPGHLIIVENELVESQLAPYCLYRVLLLNIALRANSSTHYTVGNRVSFGT